jgi:hypothetical protein
MVVSRFSRLSGKNQLIVVQIQQAALDLGPGFECGLRSSEKCRSFPTKMQTQFTRMPAPALILYQFRASEVNLQTKRSAIYAALHCCKGNFWVSDQSRDGGYGYVLDFLATRVEPATSSLGILYRK